MSDTPFTLSLAAVRVNMGLSRQELGEALGVSEYTIANWETGKTVPSAAHLIKLSALSGIPANFLRLQSSV